MLQTANTVEIEREISQSYIADFISVEISQSYIADFIFFTLGNNRLSASICKYNN